MNAYTLGFQSYPDVAASPSGDAVVVWSTDLGPGDDPGGAVSGRVFRDLSVFSDGFETGDTGEWFEELPSGRTAVRSVYAEDDK